MKTLLSILICFITLCTNGQGLEEGDDLVSKKEFSPKMAVTSYPLGFFIHNIKFGVDIGLKGKKSVKFVPLLGIGGTDNIYYVGNMLEYGIETHLKFYTTTQFSGFYYGPVVAYRNIDYDDRNSTSGWSGKNIKKNNTNAQSYRLGYFIGYQLVFSQIATLDITFGGAYNHVRGNSEDIKELGNYVEGIVPHFNLGIGFYLP